MKKYSHMIFIFIIVVYGLFLRSYSLVSSASFWNDEIFTALMSRGILWYYSPVSTFGASGGLYQILLYYLTTVSFYFFGINEIAGRIPSVIASLLLIIAIYWIVNSLTNKKAAFISTFLMTFSQMQLAWSTQLRPYIWLELFTLLNIYFLYNFSKSKKFIDRNLFLALLLSSIASLFHGTGLISLIIVVIVLTYKTVITKQFKNILYVLPIVAIGFTIFALSLPNFQQIIVKLVQFNTELLHYRIFLTHNYLWLLIGAGIGAFSLWHSNRHIFFVVMISICTIFFISIFKLNSRYVRYSTPAFPLLYILFGAGMIWTIDKVKKFIPHKWNALIASIVVLGLFFFYPIYEGKIIFLPQKYYSINADMRENPIVNYKEAFAKIDKLIEGKENVIVMDAWNDRTPWYLPDQKYVWLTWEGREQIDPIFGEKMIGSIRGFENEKTQYDSGIVIIENWPSLTPPELQDHIKKTLKHEFDQDTVPGNEADPWSISVYSWGLE